MKANQPGAEGNLGGIEIKKMGEIDSEKNNFRFKNEHFLVGLWEATGNKIAEGKVKVSINFCGKEYFETVEFLDKRNEKIKVKFWIQNFIEKDWRKGKAIHSLFLYVPMDYSFGDNFVNDLVYEEDSKKFYSYSNGTYDEMIFRKKKCP